MDFMTLSGLQANSLIFCTGEERGLIPKFSLPLELAIAHCCPCAEEAAVSTLPFEIEALEVPFSDSSCQKGGKFLPHRKKSSVLCL